jgi:hypothetical protein
MRCLLLQTKDKREFLTNEKNFKQLIEFSKTFKAKILIVNIISGPILTLEELAVALCDKNYKPEFNYEFVENKISIPAVKRQQILKKAQKVNKYILDQFLSGKVVSLSSLKAKFKNLNLSDATFCNHIKRAKDILAQKGLQVKKIKIGQYQCMI